MLGACAVLLDSLSGSIFIVKASGLTLLDVLFGDKFAGMVLNFTHGLMPWSLPCDSCFYRFGRM